MKELVLFKNENFNGVTCDVWNLDGEKWMTAKQIGVALNYTGKRPESMILEYYRLNKNRFTSKDTVVHKLRTTGNDGIEQLVNTRLFSMSGVIIICGLVPRSRSEIAGKFQDWFKDVISEVINTGKYNVIDKQIEKQIENPEIQNLLKRKNLLLQIMELEDEDSVTYKLNEMQIQNIDKEIKILHDKPKIEYHDNVLNADNLLTVTNIAKDLGTTANTLNKILNGLGVQFRNSKNSWELYSNYLFLIKEGFANYHIKPIDKPDGSKISVQNLKWTEKGRKWIIELLTEYKIIRNGKFAQ